MPSPSRYYSSNAAKTTLADSISSSATSLTLSAASNLPAQYPYTLILEKDTANEEVIEVTSLVGSSYQITRNIDSSGAKAHAVGANVEHGVSARDFTETRSHEIATTSAHGVSGDVVGTSGAQTLASKTLTTPTINGATISGTFTSTATISGGTITGAIITGLATPTASSSAATKGYIDTSVTSAAASATAAATSASSASTSASSAVTSAASAATSATAAATSAASASTSASSAATSASTMAASVTSAGISASSASTSASSALTSQTAAATSATSAAASATAAATSATSAAASATTAAASVAAIATSATSAASSATAAALSETAAATSATSAATSASSALTQATAATTSATSAATSASSAVTSAASAVTSASSALTSQTSAATSATSAATSASSALANQTAAATSATSAAASATAAAASYDQFDDRYLGTKASDPALDNDGNALVTGALYFSTVISAMKVYNGTAWGVIAADTNSFINKDVLTAKGGLISASAAGVPASLTAAATNGYVLSVDSATASGLAWVASAQGNVTLTGSETLTNKTLTSPVIGGTAITAAGNLAVQPATYILEVKGGGSTEGAIQLNCAVNTHGQIVKSQPHAQNATNTLLLPGGTTIGNSNAVLVSDTGTQTLTNKTLTSPTLTTPALGVATATSINGTTIPSSATLVTSVTSASGTRISIGGTAAAPTVDLVTTAVTAGTYTSTTLTVDAYGRITSASNGSGGGVSAARVYYMANR